MCGFHLNLFGLKANVFHTISQDMRLQDNRDKIFSSKDFHTNILRILEIKKL